MTTDLLARLHREAAKRGVAVHYPEPYGSHVRTDRHPLEIAHEVLATLKDAGYYNLQWMAGNSWRCWDSRPQHLDYFNGTFIECVVALAERP